MELSDSDAVETEYYVNAIVTDALPKRVSENELMEATLEEKVMVKLSQMINASHFDDREVDVMPFKQVFDELTVTTEGFILRDTRLVIPTSLRARVVDLAHETHLGITRIKKLIRSKVWFPGIDAMVEEKVKKCMSCQASEPSGTNLAPLQMSTMPVGPPFSSKEFADFCDRQGILHRLITPL
jgi:hypothetical protein